jgi:type IV pilus assembly protein PilQ
MDFQNADLRAVLRTFAEISGLNIVIDPQVQGTVDVALTEVPWDQALDIILRANRLGYIVDGTVVRIAPLTALEAEEGERRKLAEAQALAGELVVMTRTLSYARAADLQNLITRSVLSSRGQVHIDERTNTLIITDLQQRLTTAQELIDTLDRAEPQVEIEARIVQANQDFAKQLGIQWGILGRASQELSNALPLAFPNRGGISGRLGTQGASETIGGPDTRALPTENSGTVVNLPAPTANSAIGLTLGSINGSLNLDVILSAMEDQGQARILSNPRVTTQNNVRATIIQGDQIPIQTVANNTVTVQFRDAALQLSVTPQITAAGTVIMQVELANDFADFGRSVQGIPPIVTQRATTTVQVADGDTTVIGGIFESTQTSSRARTPGLHRIPLLGWLFRNQQQTESSDELLIFLTPRIVR